MGDKRRQTPADEASTDTDAAPNLRDLACAHPDAVVELPLTQLAELLTLLDRQGAILEQQAAETRQQKKVRGRLSRLALSLAAQTMHPHALAAVLSRGRLTWGGKTASRLSPNHATILRCLLTDDGKLRGPVPTAELLTAVYGSLKPGDRQARLKALRKSVDQLKDKLFNHRVPVVLRWSKKGSLELVDTTRRGHTPRAGTPTT
jgi:hypothetical protein